ncbi:hypothetical protein NLJ89_g12380 [Agrocybe chaxingu]|uniref:Uncharacterized protein n=1 Tax=Agrocybe chaxingu TaxID=84603 RepID=A0A9W8JQL6_9AGAR|nr:hypothetical protein NLJ89_g12380 [Agrocybe chaxingu]
MNQPLKLLASMNEQEPYHYHLLTMPVSAKNRPPPSLLAASTNYLALRGQLASELPAYLALMHRGLAVLVRRLAEVQTRWWRDVRDRWAELWEMLRVEGELNVGWEETSAVWCARWADVDEVVRGLGIVGLEPHVLIQQVIAAQALRRAGAQKQAIAQAQAHLQQGQPQAQAQQYNMEEYFAYPEFFVPASSHMQTPATQYSPPRERERERTRRRQR